MSPNKIRPSQPSPPSSFAAWRSSLRASARRPIAKAPAASALSCAVAQRTDASATLGCRREPVAFGHSDAIRSLRAHRLQPTPAPKQSAAPAERAVGWRASLAGTWFARAPKSAAAPANKPAPLPAPAQASLADEPLRLGRSVSSDSLSDCSLHIVWTDSLEGVRQAWAESDEQRDHAQSEHSLRRSCREENQQRFAAMVPQLPASSLALAAPAAKTPASA